MFEFDQYVREQHALPASRPWDSYAFERDIERISLLNWGEHCIECVAPKCYATCDLYDKRPDQRCRRFVFGIKKNRGYQSFRGYGAEAVFKKWGRLQARGNINLQPLGRVRRKEALVAFLAPLLNLVGRLVARLRGDERFHYLSFELVDRLARHEQRLSRKRSALDRSDHKHPTPDAFLLELYNPTSETLRLQFEMRTDHWQIRDEIAYNDCPAPFQAALEVPPGYFRQVFDHALYRSVTDPGYPFNLYIVPEAEEGAHLVFLTADFVTFKKSARGSKQTSRAVPPAIKCVVWDLDNTLWDGVLVESEQVSLKAGIADTLRQLDERGILLSIASKNSHDHAWSKLEELGIADYFLYPKINWQPKSENIRQVARDLNIGLDSLAFIDDNPFELEEVRTAASEVLVIREEDREDMLDDPRFQGSSSADAKNRRRYYQDAQLRASAAADQGSDYLGFLAASKIVLTLRRYQPSDYQRAVELVQRTNQLNFSGCKYNREEIADLIADPSFDKFVLDCVDRFGSYGTVGFALVRHDGEAVFIEDFMLSCRVQGKYIEKAFFAALVRDLRYGRPALLSVNFRATDRNQPAQNVLKSIGFTGLDSGRPLVLDLRAQTLDCPFIEVHRPEESGAKPAVATVG